MKKYKLLTLSILTLVFFQFSFPMGTDAAPKYPKGTMVANHSIEGETVEDARSSLIDKISDWSSEDEIKFQSDYETFYIPRSAVTFDINGTIQRINEQTKRKLTNFFIRPKNVQVPLIVQINEEETALKQLKELDYIDYDATIQQLKLFASELRDEAVPLIYVDENNLPFELVKEVEREIPDYMSNTVISYIVDKLNEYMILPEKSFSMLDAVTFPADLINAKQEMSFVASILYELFLHTNVDIISKHTPIHAPAYTLAGLAIEVDREQEKNFVIYNPHLTPLKIHAELKDDKLHLSLDTIRPENNYRYSITKVEEIEPRTIYRYSTKLDPGEQEVIQSGENGKKVTVERATYKNNIFIESEPISEEVYVPVPRIVVLSSYVLEETEEDESNLEIGLDDMITDELDERRMEMQDTIDRVDDRFADYNEVDEEEMLDSMLALLEFLEEYEDFKLRMQQFEERLDLIEMELNTNIQEEYENLQEYQKKIEENIHILNDHYNKLLELITLLDEKGA